MSDPCGCIYVGEYEPPILYDPRVVVARKEHQCHECAQMILLGERYEYVFAIYPDTDINPHVMKTCETCLSIRDAFFCEGFFHGQVMEKVRGHIYEMNGRIGFDCLDKLDDKARERILKIMEEVMEELDE